MADHTYELSEVVGTSTVNVTEAIRNGVASVARAKGALDWFEVSSIRGYIDGEAVQHFQVQMKVGGRLTDGA